MTAAARKGRVPAVRSPPRVDGRGGRPSGHATRCPPPIDSLAEGGAGARSGGTSARRVVRLECLEDPRRRTRRLLRRVRHRRQLLGIPGGRPTGSRGVRLRRPARLTPRKTSRHAPRWPVLAGARRGPTPRQRVRVSSDGVGGPDSPPFGARHASGNSDPDLAGFLFDCVASVLGDRLLHAPSAAPLPAFTPSRMRPLRRIPVARPRG